MAEMIAYGRVEKVKFEEKNDTIVIVNDGRKRIPISVPQDHYQKLINKNNGSFMLREVEVYRENGMISIKVFD